MPSSTDSSTCPPPTTILLHLTAYLVFSSAAALLLGSRSIRHHLSFHSSCLSLSPRSARTLSLSVSLILQSGATVATAYLIATSPGSSSGVPADLTDAVLLWFSRPLATFCVAWLSIADRGEYSENSREVGIVDTIYGLVNVYYYGLFAHLAAVTPGYTATREGRFVRAGAALGLLSCILNIACVARMWDLEKAWRPDGPGDGNAGGESGTTKGTANGPPFWVTLFLHGLRFAANWFLWIGLLPRYEGAFCIGGNALMKITLIWLFVPFADVLWRGFASCKEREGDYSICLEAEEP